MHRWAPLVAALAACSPAAAPPAPAQVPPEDDPPDPPEELCNGEDDDGDGSIDEDATDAVPMYLDADGDGVGIADLTNVVCPGTPGWSSVAGDCDDAKPTVSPVLADTARRCGDGVDDCSRASCEWSGTYRMSEIGAAVWYGDTEGYRFGQEVSQLGDVDGDGRPDFSVGRYVFTSWTPGVHAPRDVAAAYIDTGYAEPVAWPVLGAGDLDGNGLGDVLSVGPEPARVFFSPLAAHPPADGAIPLAAGPRWPVGGAAAGDADGDGYGEVAIWGYHGEGERWSFTGLFLYEGNESGIRADPEAIVRDAYEELIGPVWSGTGGVDLDADGRPDLAVAFDESGSNPHVAVFSDDISGELFVHDGASSYLYGAFPDNVILDLDGAGDPNGDGYPDLLVGYATDEYTSCAAALVLGPIMSDASLTNAAARFYTLWPGDAGLGAEVRGLGDVNGDGKDDFGIAAEREGSVYLYFDMPEGHQDLDDADAELVENGATTGRGWDTVGDLDEDGRNDLVIGQSAWAHDQYHHDEGMAALILGWTP
jgi:hypothetical protein